MYVTQLQQKYLLHVEVWECISNFIPHITEHMIIYPCWR